MSTIEINCRRNWTCTQLISPCSPWIFLVCIESQKSCHRQSQQWLQHFHIPSVSLLAVPFLPQEKSLLCSRVNPPFAVLPLARLDIHVDFDLLLTVNFLLMFVCKVYTRRHPKRSSQLLCLICLSLVFLVTPFWRRTKLQKYFIRHEDKRGLTLFYGSFYKFQLRNHDWNACIIHFIEL